MDALEFTLPLPPPALSPNGRGHWSERHRARTGYIEQVRVCLWEQLGLPLPRLAAARIELGFRFRDRRRRDVDNSAAAASKPILDALVGAGMLPDDDFEHIPAMVVNREIVKGGEPCVVVRLTPIEPMEGEG